MRKSLRLFAAAILAAVCLVGLRPVSAGAEPKAFEYLLPEADTRVYSMDELGGMSLQVVNYAKNEVYARHGRKFNSQELRDYFSEQPWYNGTIEPGDFKESELNSYELANVELLAQREKELSWDGNGYELNQAGYTFDEVYRYLYDDYDILEGLEVYATSGTAIMDGAKFYMTLPAEPAWSYIQLDRYAFEIFYPPAREGGFGGHVVSIVAFDWGDNSYEEYPAWTICGESAEKKYVAVFPTDVQFNWEDSTQSEEYGKLSEWAEALNVQSADNPFQVIEPEGETEETSGPATFAND